MSRAVRTQHTPGRGASHSRWGGLRWRRPRPGRQPFTRPLRRSRHALESTLNRIEASARVIDAAERFGLLRPAAAAKQLVLVALWLAEAAVHLDRAGRGLDETFTWLAIAVPPADVPQRIGDATARCLDAGGQLVHLYNRLYDTRRQLRGAVVDGVIRREPVPSPAVVAAIVPRPIVARDSGGAPSIFNAQPRPAAAAVAGAQKVSRGRAPPFPSTCLL